MHELLKLIKQTIAMFFILTIVTGVIYPLLVTVVAQLVFPYKAHGSLLVKNGVSRGSYLIGQNFTSTQYFWGRPSATAKFPYNPMYSAATNLGSSNPKFINQVNDRVNYLTNAEHASAKSYKIPIDLVTASASGLDPDISPLAAFYQISRVANARHMKESDLETLVIQNIQEKTLHILGEERVNVLALNVALDNTYPCCDSIVGPRPNLPLPPIPKLL